jgi:organic hydroperoxide reductase OsmC/OhrA
MSQHKATINWKCGSPADFTSGRFSREHTWTLDGGLTVPASSSPAVVRPPLSNPANIDPEEAYVASISSCHMLTFLYLAKVAGFQIDAYEDEAVGEMAKNAEGAWWIATVTLSPRITWGGDNRPSHDEETQLHHKAHHGCFIAQSVKTDIKVAGHF